MARDPTDDPSLPPPDDDGFEWTDELPEDATLQDVYDEMVRRGIAPVIQAKVKDAEPVVAAPSADNRVYKIRSTSLQSAEGEEPLELSLRGADVGKLTKRLIDYEIVENSKNPEAAVRIRFHHQRRAGAAEEWAPAPTFKLSELQAGHEVTLELSAAETLALLKYLNDLYAIAKEGIPSGERVVRVVDDSAVAAMLQRGTGKDVLAGLITQHGEGEFIRILNELQPNLAAAAGLAAVHERRSAALAEFEHHMKAGDWSERDWYPFFKANQWIFGHGLAYQFLQDVQAQPHYGGEAVSGKGGQIGDNLMSTTASVRFSVLVEVKRPDTLLLRNDAYRTGVYSPSEELAGGTAQLQTNCRTWATEGSKAEANRNLGVDTYEPKGILVIGSLAQFAGDTKDAKARSFELFRRNLHNPEIVTFDELLERARFLVASSAPPDAKHG